MYQDVQRYARTKMVLPLRVWLDDRQVEASPALLAHTIDTSDSGCRLGGLRTELSPGQIITLQRGKYKAAFRVIWSKQLAPHENQAGVEALDNSIPIWLASSAAPEPAKPVAKLPVGSEAVSPAVPALNKPQPGPRQRTAHASGDLLYWGAAAALAIFSLSIGLYLYSHVFSGSTQSAIQPPVPGLPTAEDLARLGPKPHLRVLVSRPLDPSPTRVEVAEAPTGHVVYPTAPENSGPGKVRLQIVVAANGLVKQIHVLSGKQQLAEAAAQAVRMWHYASLSATSPFKERQTSVTVSFVGADAVSLQFPRANAIAQTSEDN